MLPGSDSGAAAQKGGFDANTWTYIAVDLIRHVKRLHLLYSDSGVAGAGAVGSGGGGEQTWLGEASSVAAALTMVFWGMAHGECNYSAA